jgi:glutaredoxin
MEIKLFTQPTCFYCKNVKDKLTENGIEFTEIDITQDENRYGWNLVTRMSGLGMTPTVQFKDQIWSPQRDFTDPNSLVQRLKYFIENPLPTPTEDEKFMVLLNGIKNLSLSIQKTHQSVVNIQGKLNKLTQSVEPTNLLNEKTTE